MRADLCAGGHIELYLGLGADHRADVTAVKDCPTLAPRKPALEIHKRRPHLGDHRDPACRLPCGKCAQVAAVHVFWLKGARGGHRIAAHGPDGAVQ